MTRAALHVDEQEAPRRFRLLVQSSHRHQAIWATWVIVLALLSQLLLAQNVWGDTSKGKSETTALMLSDLHVNVFYDPRKINELIDSPVSRWEEILSRPDSPTRAQDFNALHTECQTANDPSPFMFAATLRSIASHVRGVSFVTISGDFLPHKIDCTFARIIPNASPQQYASFTAKIVAYEVLQVRTALPHAIVYLALGNNDSNCSDNRLDTDTEWLKVLAGVTKQGIGGAWDKRATESFEQGGYYSVRMAAPMRQTRLIVANDVLLSGGFRNCSGKADPDAAERQMAWLKAQLKEARDQHEHVWFMTHIPPGLSATLRPNMADMCKPDAKIGANESMLADALMEYTDVIKLAIFGHTHQDQIQLLDGSTGAIPVKIVRASPSYTLAQVDPLRAELVDYSVMQPEGAGTNWTTEYAFSSEYGYKGYTSQNLQRLIARFSADGSGTNPASQHYMLHISGGSQERAQELQRTWPAVACQMDHVNPAEYKHCVCQSRLGPSLGAISH